MKKNKLLKFVLPSLAVTPIIGVAVGITSCAAKEEDKGPDATKVTITLDKQELKDQTEFDIKTTKKLQLSAKVEPAEANQDVAFEIVKQEGTGNIACSSTGIIYTNGCVGAITIKAVSKTKNKLSSDLIELIFWDSESVIYREATYEEKDVAYMSCKPSLYDTIQDVVIPSTITNDLGKAIPVIGVSYGAFNGCASLRYVRFPKVSNDFLYIGAYSFYQCLSLKAVNVPDSVTLIDDGAFSGCSDVTTINLGKNIKYIENGAFQNCSKVTNIDLPESLFYIGSRAFFQCFGIKNFHIPKGVKIIGESAFVNCWASHITIDADHPYFMTDGKAIYNKNQTRLLSCQYDYFPTANEKVFDIPASVEKIDARAFEYCDRLEWIKFPEDSACTSIGEGCFALCSGLTQVILPKNIVEIKPSTFAYCWSLQSITIPKNVSVIQVGAFYGCDKLERATFETDDSNVDSLWMVTTAAVDPTFVGEYNTTQNTMEPFTDKPTENAYKLTEMGQYRPNSSNELEWEGGYATCTWIRKDISMTGIMPYGSLITYNKKKNPEIVNLGQKSVDITLDIGGDVSANKYFVNIYNNSGDPVSTEVQIVSTAEGEFKHTFTFNSEFAKSESLYVIVYINTTI